jgi:hypothetical protein
MPVSTISIHEHLALQQMLGGPRFPLVGAAASHFSAAPYSVHPRMAQLVALEATLLARRAMQPQPSSSFLKQLLAEQMKKKPVKLRLDIKPPLGTRYASPDSVLLKSSSVTALSNLKPVVPPSSSNEEGRIRAKPADLDILCGRGGRSNHHVGNKRYRQVVGEMKASYRTVGSKSAKTDLSRAIVEHVQSYGGRFVKLDKATGKYVMLTQSEARKKTSQALREAKDVKWM